MNKNSLILKFMNKRNYLRYALLLLLSAMSFSVANAQESVGDTVASKIAERPNDSKQTMDPLKTKIDKMPMFPGGTQALLKYLSENVKYPVDAEKKKKSGRVIVRFVVDTDGSIDDVEVAKSVWPSLDDEAVRVTEAMPKWRPGIKDGKVVRVRFTLPITFQLR